MLLKTEARDRIDETAPGSNESNNRSFSALSALLVVIAGSMFIILALLAHRYTYFSWDVSITQKIQSTSLPGFDHLMLLISIPGYSWGPPLLVFLTSLLIFSSGLKTEAITLAAGAGSGYMVDTIIKVMTARPRPSGDLVHVLRLHSTESFPSGHVFFYVIFFGLLFYFCQANMIAGILKPILITLCLAMILLVGISRVYLGAHWPSDVLGGYLAGGLWLMLTITLQRRLGRPYVSGKNRSSDGPSC